MKTTEQTFDLYIAAAMTATTEEAYQKNAESIKKFIAAILKQQEGQSNIFFAGNEIDSLSDLTYSKEDTAAHVTLDLEQVKAHNNFILIYPEKVASSTLVEAGWALAYKKTVCLSVKPLMTFHIS